MYQLAPMDAALVNRQPHVDAALWGWVLEQRQDPLWASMLEAQRILAEIFQPRWMLLITLTVTAILVLQRQRVGHGLGGSREAASNSQGRHAPGSLQLAKVRLGQSPWYPGIALLAATVTSTILKHTIDRPRPPEVFRLSVETNPSMPSGHAIAAFALATALTLHLRRRWCAALWLLAVIVGCNRLYLGVHWLSDVVCGAVLGVVVALVVAVVWARAARPRAT